MKPQILGIVIVIILGFLVFRTYSPPQRFGKDTKISRTDASQQSEATKDAAGKKATGLSQIEAGPGGKSLIVSGKTLSAWDSFVNKTIKFFTGSSGELQSASSSTRQLSGVSSDSYSGDDVSPSVASSNFSMGPGSTYKKTAIGAAVNSRSQSTDDSSGTGQNDAQSLNSKGLGDQWEFVGWYGGGCYPNLVFDPNRRNRLFLISDVAGIWRSDDLGERWIFKNYGLTNISGVAIVVAPSDSNVVYAAMVTGLFYSRDAGESWTKADTVKGAITFVRPTQGRPIAVSKSDASKVCVGTAGGKVFCSSNYGQSWSERTGPANFFPEKQPVRALVYYDSSSFFVATATGLYKYIDGQRWSALITGVDAYDVEVSSLRSNTIYLGAGDKIYISTNSGASWTNAVPKPNFQIKRLAIAEDINSTFIYITFEQGWKGGVMYSENSGATWSELNSNSSADLISNPTEVWNPDMGRTNSIRVNPYNHSVLFRTDWYGVWRSDNRGKTWEEKIVGTPNTVGTDIIFNPSGILFVSAMDDGLLRSEDAGKTYRAVFPSKQYSDDINGHVWRVIALSEQKIIATSTPWAVSINQVIISTDGGNNFERISLGIRPKQNTIWSEGYARGLARDPKDKNRIYLGIDGDDGGGLFISNNGGRSWAASPGQPASKRIYSGLVVDPKDSNVIYWAATGDNGGIYVSNDKGLTWRKSFDRSTWVFDLHAASDGTIYAGAANFGPSVYVSRNKGVSWEKIMQLNSLGAAKGLMTSPIDSKIVVVSTVSWDFGSPQRILLSRDAGVTWKDITSDLPPGGGAAAMAFSNDGRYLYLNRLPGGVYRYLLD